MSSNVPEYQVVLQAPPRPGRTSSIIGLILAVLGIISFGFIFSPIALICSIFGVIRGIFAGYMTSIGLGLVGLMLSIAGIMTSPVLLIFLSSMHTRH